MQSVTRLPQPSAKHATCAWCRLDFDTIVDLIDHVEGGHVRPHPSTADTGCSDAA